MVGMNIINNWNNLEMCEARYFNVYNHCFWSEDRFIVRGDDAGWGGSDG